MNDTYTPAYGTPNKLTRGYVLRLFAAGAAVAAAIMATLILTLIFENVIIFYTAIVLFIAGAIVRLHLMDKLCSFSADDREVVFRTVFRTYRYAYSDIEDLAVSREMMTREKGRFNRYRYFAEKLTVTSADGKKTFAREMDADVGLVVSDPEKLREIFENGKFMCLKRYIEETKAGK